MKRYRTFKVTVFLVRKAVVQLVNRNAETKGKVRLDLQSFRNICK